MPEVPEEPILEEIRKLIKLVEESNLSELTVEEDGVTITIKGVAEAAPAPSVGEQPAAPPPPHHEIVPAPAPAEPVEDKNLVRIESPMVGVFYRSSSPDAPPLIEVGDTIEVGQTIGLIEAMKVFSEIPSEVAGEVVEIPAQNSKLVQQGETLVVVRVS